MYFGPHCGGSIYDASSLLMEELYSLIVEDNKTVEYTWLVQHHGLGHYDALKELTRFAEACPLKLNISYMVSGVCRHTGHHYSIVAEDLYTTLDLFEEDSRTVCVSKVSVMRGESTRQCAMVCDDDDEEDMITEEDVTPNHQQLFEQKRSREDDEYDNQLKRRYLQRPDASTNHYCNFFAQKFQM
eukprot:TRINITY_DN7654_c0_g4_i2.p1 TRINITY_DN7654_c0_g4~~TRINITY_DN7654_c0_g4_i2.p1  ORF type:complete len:185 (+),score=26.38 TRINITY_DN7654_c0_g4_i2:56-610(+)